MMKEGTNIFTGFQSHTRQDLLGEGVLTSHNPHTHHTKEFLVACSYCCLVCITNEDEEDEDLTETSIQLSSTKPGQVRWM